MRLHKAIFRIVSHSDFDNTTISESTYHVLTHNVDGPDQAVSEVERFCYGPNTGVIVTELIDDSILST